MSTLKITLAVVVVWFASYLVFKQTTPIDSENSEAEQTQSVTIKRIEVPKIKYLVRYKDGSETTVEAHSYIWDFHKIKFLVNDTVNVMEISADIVEEINEVNN